MKKLGRLFLKRERGILLAAVSIFWAGLYFGIDALPPLREAAYLDWDPVWRLPYLDYFVIPYLSLYLMPLGLLAAPHEPKFFRRLAVTFMLAILASSACFMLLPLELPRIPPDSGAFSPLVALVYANDAGGNFFPSQHVINSFLLALGIGRLKPSWRLPMLLWASVITASTVLIRQHYVVDAVAGLAMALISWSALIAYERLMLKST